MAEQINLRKEINTWIRQQAQKTQGASPVIFWTLQELIDAAVDISTIFETRPYPLSPEGEKSREFWIDFADKLVRLQSEYRP